MRHAGPSFRAVPFTRPPLSVLALEVPDEARWHPALDRIMVALPGGPQHFWGVPFDLRPARSARRWIWLTAARPDVEIRLPRAIAGSHVVVAHFSVPGVGTRSPVTGAPTGRPLDPGRHLADYTLRTAAGTRVVHAIRRRFEINDVLVGWGQLPFAARPHREVRALVAGPHEAAEWGLGQVGAEMPMYAAVDVDTLVPTDVGSYWLTSLPLPGSGERLGSITLALRGPDPIAVAAITVYHGNLDPLQRSPTRTILVSGRGRPDVAIDLGTVAREISVEAPDPGWLREPAPGLGSEAAPTRARVLEFTANDDATLRVGGHILPVRDLLNAGSARANGVRIELLPPVDRRIHVRVVDAQTGRTTPARVHFRAADGRYLPPDGHSASVSTGWFEDHGADLRLGSTSYAYIDGECDLRCPIGPLHVEVVKGFEFEPVRESIEVTQSTGALELRLHRHLAWQGRGWITADTHVHFVSPTTAGLEAAAEGVDIVNLLAATWGRLNTNFGDFVGAPTEGGADRAIVWVGSENRHHFLGHLALLGVHKLVPPFSTGGPSEASLGVGTDDGYLTTWADRARREAGLVVVPHFPNPYSEVVAAALLDKIDAVEIKDFTWGIDSFGVAEWYRLLNAGLRIAAVGGTDKMSAGVPIGGVRTYADVASADISFAAFAAAVRAGRTFTTSGPLVTLEVEGVGPGGEVRLPSEARLEVRASARSIYPLGTLEVVHDGRVVAQEDAASGDRAVDLAVRVDVRHDGWIAARVSSPVRAWHVWPVLLAAHTSPVYLTGRPGAIPDRDRAYLRTVLEGGLVWIDRIGQSESQDSLEPLRQSFRDAQRALSMRS